MSSVGHRNEARSTNFLFTIGLNRDLTFSVQSSNVNDLTMGFAPFPTGVKDLKIPTNKIENSPLVIDIIISEDYYEWIEIYKWMLKCKNTNDSHLSQVETCSLITLGAHNEQLTEFIYGDVFPTELSGITYTTNEDGSTVISVSVTFNFNTFKVKLPSGEVIDEQYS